MNYYVKANRVINKLIKDGKRKFIIFPFGEQGMLVKRILNERYGIREELIIDNHLDCTFLGNMTTMNDLNEGMIRGCTLLLCSDNEDYRSEIRRSAIEKFAISSIVDVFSYSLYFDLDNYYDELHYNAYDFNGSRYRALEAVARELYYNSVEGEVAECGVYKGKFADYISRFFPNRLLYLFDTFEGFDERDLDYKEDGAGESVYDNWKRDWPLNDSSIEIALDNISYKNNAKVYKGWFPTSAYGTDAEKERFAFVSLDTDLYQPIMAGLRFFWPRMSPGGIIFVHDYVNVQLPGVYKAVIEFCRQEHVGYTRASDNFSALLIKPY